MLFLVSLNRQACCSGVRPVPLEIHIQGFDITNLDSRMQAMARPCYSALTNHGLDKPAIIFVPSKRHARQTAVDIWAYASADGKGDKFLQVSSHLQSVPDIIILSLILYVSFISSSSLYIFIPCQWSPPSCVLM